MYQRVKGNFNKTLIYHFPKCSLIFRFCKLKKKHTSNIFQQAGHYIMAIFNQEI